MATFYRRTHITFIREFSVTVKCITQDVNGFTGFRYVAEFFRQIQQTCFVFDDGLVV